MKNIRFYLTPISYPVIWIGARTYGQWLMHIGALTALAAMALSIHALIKEKENRWSKRKDIANIAACLVLLSCYALFAISFI